MKRTAMGVVTYFLLCGYTPFGACRFRTGLERPADATRIIVMVSDRENQVDEVQAICNADYAYEPAEYWVGVSDTGQSRGQPPSLRPV